MKEADEAHEESSGRLYAHTSASNRFIKVDTKQMGDGFCASAYWKTGALPLDVFSMSVVAPREIDAVTGLASRLAMMVPCDRLGKGSHEETRCSKCGGRSPE